MPVIVPASSAVHIDAGAPPQRPCKAEASDLSIQIYVYFDYGDELDKLSLLKLALRVLPQIFSFHMSE